jgi:hypothetical protein
VQALRALAALIALGGVALADRPGRAITPDDLMDPMALPRRAPVPPPATPAPESAVLGKQLDGLWKCTTNGPAPVTRTVSTRVALDGGWLETTTFSTGERPGVPVALEYLTYDGVAKLWTRLTLDDAGGRTIATSLGEDHGEWQWTGTSIRPGATTELRDRSTLSATKQTHVTEARLGGTWIETSRVSCARP